MSSSAGYEFLKRFLHPNKKDATALASISPTSNNLQNLHPGHWLWSDQEWVKAKFSFIATLSLGSKHFCIIINIFDRCQRWIQIIRKQSYSLRKLFSLSHMYFKLELGGIKFFFQTINFFWNGCIFCTWRKYHISVLARKSSILGWSRMKGWLPGKWSKTWKPAERKIPFRSKKIRLQRK